jgi:DUF1680 family protein
MTHSVRTAHDSAEPLGSTTTAAPVRPNSGTLQPLGLDEVRIDGGFWGLRQDLNRSAILWHIKSWLEKSGWLNNFDAVVRGDVAHVRTGREFADSEVYKFLEALAGESFRDPGGWHDDVLRATTRRIAAAQQDDGYLNTKFGNPGQDPRYSDFEWGHELYCFGHLIQAGVARLRTGVSDELVRVAIAAADHVCAEFGAQGRPQICGHPEIETALVELFRATGERKYLEQAKLFIERRGRRSLADIEFGRSYFQDDLPVREQESLTGHAVRALYLASAVVDAGVEDGDSTLIDAASRQYHHALARRTYLTGGMGSHHQDEAFGDDFELPPDRAYCETCAGVASIMVSWRLLLATGDLRYADVIERTLYNVVAASPSEEGTAFFYTNPLQQRVLPDASDPYTMSPRAHAQLRAPWFEVSCCPPNVARTLAQLGTYVATRSSTGVQLLQYVPGRIRVHLDSGEPVDLAVRTRFPAGEQIRIEVVDAPASPWTLSLRVPGWADGAIVSVNGDESPAEAPGHDLVDLSAGDVVELVLPQPPRFVYPDPRVDAVRSTVAVQRGPLVLCLESVDLPSDIALEQVELDPASPPTAVADGARCVVRVRRLPAEPAGAYAFDPLAGDVEPSAREVELVPYHRWAERGPSTMRVWIPRS